jgi:hypothetical protein
MKLKISSDWLSDGSEILATLAEKSGKSSQLGSA